MVWLVGGAVLILAALAGIPLAAQDATPVPADVEATPAIDPEKLASNPLLKVTDARNRTTSANNLKMLGLAVHNYASVNGGKLPGDILDKDGKALLSWRVLLLPYLEEGKLYKEFKLYEPWDSKNNLPLLEKMPKALTSPRVVVKNKGYTVYQIFSGPGALFAGGKTKYLIGNIPDGTSNTIFAVETSKAVPWTKPTDIPYDRKKDLPDFGKAYSGRPQILMMDGSVRMLDVKRVKPGTLKNAICPDDGEPLGKDWD
jgi:hypothetical protein